MGVVLEFHRDAGTFEAGDVQVVAGGGPAVVVITANGPADAYESFAAVAALVQRRAVVKR